MNSCSKFKGDLKRGLAECSGCAFKIWTAWQEKVEEQCRGREWKFENVQVKDVERIYRKMIPMRVFFSNLAWSECDKKIKITLICTWNARRESPDGARSNSKGRYSSAPARDFKPTSAEALHKTKETLDMWKANHKCLYRAQYTDFLGLEGQIASINP